MADGPVTYEQLFDALRREKSRDELQALDKDFYDKARIFLSEKHALIGRDAGGLQSLASQRASIEAQNAQKILRELYERRERKIITMAMHRTRTDAAIIETDALLPEERPFLESLVHLLLQTREMLLSSIESRHSSLAMSPRQETPAYEHVETTEMTEQHDAARLALSPSAPSPQEPVAQHAAPPAAHSDLETSFVTVRFVAPVPKFFGKDMRVFGPYETGSSAALPEAIAHVLVKKGRAQEIDG